jgi:hypothetical protein
LNVDAEFSHTCGYKGSLHFFGESTGSYEVASPETDALSCGIKMPGRMQYDSVSLVDGPGREGGQPGGGEGIVPGDGKRETFGEGLGVELGANSQGKQEGYNAFHTRSVWNNLYGIYRMVKIDKDQEK